MSDCILEIAPTVFMTGSRLFAGKFDKNIWLFVVLVSIVLKISVTLLSSREKGQCPLEEGWINRGKLAVRDR